MTTTAARPASAGRAEISAKTLRTDRWWLAPALTTLGITTWVAYATVRVFMQDYYWVAQYRYLTPFYSPCVSDGCTAEAAEFGRFLPDVWFLPYAAVSLPFLLLFRFTCYYYRKAYYRSYWLSPPACAVPDAHKTYQGESRFPMIFQNSHRYLFTIAAIISVINTWDAVVAMDSNGAFGFGLGNVVLWANVVLLWGYTASCHSCRHILGGRLKHFSKHPMRYKTWTFISKLNAHHMGLAWTTLTSLAVTDFYIMAVSAGWIHDLRFIN